MNLDAPIQTFVMECAELLDAMESTLLRLENEPAAPGLLDAIFRAAHTIKGSAGLFGFDDVVAFAHRVESVLDRVRGGDLAVAPRLTALLLECCDQLRALVRAATGGVALDAGSAGVGAQLAGKLASLLETEGAAAAALDAAPRSDGELAPQPELRDWRLDLGFGREVFRNGMDPISFVRYLGRLGEIRSVRCRGDALPAAAEADPESCYLRFEIWFRGAVSREEIEKVFEFVRDDCELVIERRSEAPARPAPRDSSSSVEAKRSDEGAPLASPAEAPSRAAPATPAGGRSAAEAPRAAEPKAREGRLIRIDADKLDQLIDLIGELVIAGAGTRVHAERTGLSDLVESTASISRLVEEVRNTALGLRMVQIGGTFQRFQRVVHDVSHELGKDIELVIDGAETELDKSMVEKLSDPLLHLVRNAIDHGIEPVQLRAASGKSPRGRIGLNALHDSGSVVVEVSDDGGGLDRDRILEKAISRGLVPAGQTLTEREVFELIFKAGFSTAEQVSNLSGRGVGMDVVRRSVEALHGTVEVESQLGRGTVVRLRLPLTLAIIDGFLVRSGRVHYVIPLDMVVECLAFSAAERRSAHERGFVGVRGAALPIVRLGDLFGLPAKASQRENVVVVKSGAQQAGVVVDELLGELQTVIKPLGKLFGHVRGISGSALLGSGEVALILDVNALVHQLASREQLDAHERASSASGEPQVAASLAS